MDGDRFPDRKAMDFYSLGVLEDIGSVFLSMGDPQKNPSYPPEI